MKKLFIKFSMMLFVLGMSTNTVWADMSGVMQQIESYPFYFAQVTGHASSTGGGKVYVTAQDATSEEDDPRNGVYTEDVSNVCAKGIAVSMQGMIQASIWSWAKPDDGYYFVGWSFSDGGTDLGNGGGEAKYAGLYDVAENQNETINYDIYATFEPIRIKDYSVTGNNTLSGGQTTCTQTVIFQLDGENIDLADFKNPVIKDISGGTWAFVTEGGELASTKEEELALDGYSVAVKVKFTAPDASPSEYSATLVFETEAGVKMEIHLAARTIVEGVEALLFDGKVQKESEIILLEDLLKVNTAKYANPIIRLNGDYASPVTIDKSITFDLNGYTLSNMLTVSDGNVVLAYSRYGGTVHVTTGTAIDLTGGTLSLNGGTITSSAVGVNIAAGAKLIQNGATITAPTAILNNGELETKDGIVTGSSECAIRATSGSVTTIDGGSFYAGTTGAAVQIAGANANAYIKKGTIASSTSAPYSQYGVSAVDGAYVEIEKLAVINGNSKSLKTNGGTSEGTIIINGGKFHYPNDLQEGNEANVTLNSAYFRVKDEDMTEFKGKQLWRNTSGAEFREGYEYLAGDYEEAKAAGVSICHIGGTTYSSLEDALAFANNTNDDVTIIMDNDYILPAGYYTLPRNAKLIIPMSDEQGSEYQIVNRESSYVKPFKHRCLVLTDGVNLDVHGTIEVSGSQLTSDAMYTGAPTGSYGQLQLNKGSRVVLQNASLLRAWGFVTGDVEHKNATTHVVPSGEIDARRGSTVREMFQMGDWKGGLKSGTSLLAGDSIFPLSDYFIQNIEAPVKYHPGASLIATTTVSALGAVTMSANDIKIVGIRGDVAMFLMDPEADAENTWVRKWYDASKDQQVYEINSGANIGRLVIQLISSPLLPQLNNMPFTGNKTIQQFLNDYLRNQGYEGDDVALADPLVMNSGQYFLPITTNFKLHLLTGEMGFTQSTELLPGSELEVDKEATVFVYEDTPDDGVRGGSLYVFDYRDWGDFAGGVPANKVKYSPSFDDGVNGGAVPDDVRDVSTCEALGHAKINVHGSFDTQGGYVFTTEHGGDIFSSVEDAGTFLFSLDAKPADYTEQIAQYGSSSREYITCKPAYLHNSNAYVTNGGNEYQPTGGTEEGTSYCYLDIDGNGGHWADLKQRGCFTYDNATHTYYIKPQEYVAVAVNAVWDEENGEFTSLSGNDDNTFSDAAGAGRLFINLGNPYDASSCQWWEVEQKHNYYHCIHPDNDTYYYWVDSAKEWKEVEFTITWKDWDGSPITTYTVPYGTQAEWLSTNPTREKTVDYTYSFTGWSPALGKVTSDVTYTATYQQDTIKYTIVFVKDGGVEIERHLLPRDSVPVCENVPTRTGYILQWEPGIEPVVGNQTYTATWLPEPPPTYTITFKNYDGTVLKKANGTDDAVYTVTADGTPIYDGTTPTKTVNEGKEYTYEFTGWKPTLAPATTNATYVAQFNEVAQTYVINFYDENEETIIKTENLTYGATPTPPAVTKTNPAEGYTYTYVWKNTTDASKTIETVTAAASYKPVFKGTPNKYTVTLQCNVPGACTFTGAGIHTYGDEVAISATIKDPTTYEFVNWSDQTTHSFGSQTITGDVSYTVMVKETNKTPVDLPVGIDETETIASATDYMNVTITSDGVDHSSQIVNANNITLYGNADFVFKQTIKAGYWYSFAVPWRVDATSGVYLGSSSTPAVLGKDFEIIYYDGSVRAAQGKVDACWVYLKNVSTKKVLEPGRAYMIFIKHGSQSQIVFRKKVQEPILTTTATVNQYNAVSNLDANWNAIANPALYHAYMFAGAGALGFYYKSEEDQFDWYDLTTTKLVVGEPVYIQAPTTGTIVANSSSYAAAPRRAKAEQATCFDVQIAAAGAAKHADHIRIQIDENKEENKYVIGKDLTKFGVSAKLAQMWINRYDVKLCFNTIAPEGDNTSFPMSIYAPKAGEYTIAIEREVATEDYALYLTYNGEAIWNLSDGAYTVNLNKGTDANYGLRISVRKAPEVATGMDEAVVDAQGDIRKVLINNQVLIIRGEKVYSIDGQLVK